MLRQYSHSKACSSGRAYGWPAGMLSEAKVQPLVHASFKRSRQQVGLARYGPVCSSAASEALTLERPREAQQTRTRHHGGRRPASDTSDVSKHNQDLLQWLDQLTEDLADEGGHILEEELQRAVETALRVQAQHMPPHGETQSAPRVPRRPGRQHRQQRRNN